jgi:hypothetical protein
MFKTLSIKSLYALALAEGEGVGTAYEYFAKRLLLQRWLEGQKRPSRILIAGLPEKYGSSLDFLQLAQELGAAVTVVDERPSALAKWQNSWTAAQKKGWLTAVTPQAIPINIMAGLAGARGPFDLILSSEVLQRLNPDEQVEYVQQIREVARCELASTAIALFTPNGDNPAHTHISGLAGLRLNQLQMLSSHIFPDAAVPLHGYIDMPPFPPGITRSDAQREQATSGPWEAIAMWGLGYYARAEQFLPHSIRRKQSHIVYGLLSVAQP